MLGFVTQQQSRPRSQNRAPSIATTTAATTTSAASSSASLSSTSAHQKRVQTWIEGWAVLGHRSRLTSTDAAEAWAAIMRAVTRTAAVPQQAHDPSSSFSEGFQPIQQQQQHQFQQFFDLEAEQVIATHRAAEAATNRLQKDQMGLRSVVARATEALDLGEGLSGPSVSRLKNAAAMIETSLQSLREEERSLGDVVTEAEKAMANVTKKMLHQNKPPSSSSSSSVQAASRTQNHTDPASGLNSSSSTAAAAAAALPAATSCSHSSSSQHQQPTADEKLRRFLDCVGGRTFGWPKSEHDIFMHVLFSGGFEDAAHTGATPSLGLRLSENHNCVSDTNFFSLADDDAWVVGRVVERLTPTLPHRLPDDIKRHFCLQRELEFLESQRRLEVKSWRDQREADATFDLGIAAALARTEAEEEQSSKKESEFERRQRQEHLHLLVDRWKHKKDVAAATAAAAMAMTRRAMEEAKTSRRQAIQAASTERTNQLLERRQMQRGAALWSTCAKQLGCRDASSSATENLSPKFSSGLSKEELSAALHERREAALEQARQKRERALEADKKKTEREERLKMAADVARHTAAAASSARPSSVSGNRLTTRDPNRLLAPTASSQNRQAAACDAVRGGETDGGLKSRILSRDGKAPYLTPRTMTSHRRGMPFA